MKRLVCMLAIAAAAIPAQYAHSVLAGERVVLSIKGNVSKERPTDFTIEQLEALGTTVIRTKTPWHDGVVTFEGVPLAKLMKHVGASGKVAYVLALNNYSTEIPLSDFREYGTILATKKNGRAMPISEKGPLFVIYPFDSNPNLNSELYFARSAWQVRRIRVE